MKCPFGTTQPKLVVLPIRTVFMAGKPMANISDHVPMMNIPSFGNCRTVSYPPTGSATAAACGTLTPMPCVPGTTSPWMRGKNDVLVKGQPAVLKSSYCQCQWGGVITIVNDGQGGEGTQYVTKKQREEFNREEQESENAHTGQSQTNNSQSSSSYQKERVEKGRPLNPQWAKEKIPGFSSYSPEMMDRMKAYADKMHSNLTPLQRWKIAENEVQLERKFNQVKGPNRTAKGADVQSSNKYFGISDSFKVNCATASAAYVLRRRGFDITAKGKVTDSGSLNDKLSKRQINIWLNEDGTEAKYNLAKDWMYSNKVKSMTPENWKKYFEEQCKDEGTYSVRVTWKKYDDKLKKYVPGGSHATIVEKWKDQDGKMHLSYIEPQVYNPDYGVRIPMEELYDKLVPEPMAQNGVLRVDNKVFDTKYSDLFYVNKPKPKTEKS